MMPDSHGSDRPSFADGQIELLEPIDIAFPRVAGDRIGTGLGAQSMTKSVVPQQALATVRHFLGLAGSDQQRVVLMQIGRAHV